MPCDTNDELRTSLHEHLAWWGLRHIESDAAYFAWQRDVLTPQELTTLHRHIEAKRAANEGSSAEIAFYDLTARPRSVPVLYSQRYDYYLQVGSRVAGHLGGATSILDVGCGIGILTTFYARHCPGCTVLGVDRSSASIDLARQRAEELGLANLRFECLDLDRQDLSGLFDLVIATHTLLQAEQEPGLPSRNWRTFERSQDAQAQQRFERRTGVGARLDRLKSLLAPQGRVILFEKARLLARRVPFQRALAARGFQLLVPPAPVRYRSVEDVTDDGPLYVLGVVPQDRPLPWDESPEPDEAMPLDLGALRSAQAQGDQPLYENHASSAQRAWRELPGKQVWKEATDEGSDGRQLHVEWGRAGAFVYLYCANTFDRRQLALVEPARAAVLETYYGEITSDMPGGEKE